MGRKLPWDVQNDEKPGGHSNSKPKLVKHVENKGHATGPIATAASNPSSTRSRHDKVEKRGTRWRTPSTSPPPAPPEIELMREGFDADDAYMMVEDEFQDVASSFTAHLHHAEYKRFMRNAKAARRTELPELSSQMSQETKLKLKQATLVDKQRVGLSRMTSRSAREDDRGTLSEDDEEDVSDPWAGTSLARLMTTNSQPKTSLKGLERISSSTKAAQGYGPLRDKYHNDKPASDDIQPRNIKLDKNDTKAEPNHPPSNTKRNRGNDFAGTDKRDLQETRQEGFSASSAGRWAHDSHQKPQVYTNEVKKQRSRIDDLDDFDEDFFDRKAASEMPQVRATKELKEDVKKAKHKNSRLDEVPVFLV